MRPPQVGALPLVLGLLVAAWPAPAVAATAPTLHIDDDPASPTYGSFEARGLSDPTLRRLRARPRTYGDWIEHFAVYTADTRSGADRPPVLGSYAVEGDRVRFTPRFPTTAGLRYRAVWIDPPVEAHLSLPAAPDVPSTVVSAIYPSADEVPENLLKIYLHFSAPMSRGDAHRHLTLTRGGGGEIEAPFVAPDVELWNPEGDRLTLFFDPGRIKRGLEPHAELGTPLVAGETVRLTVDPAWRDARGATLVSAFEKRYRITTADRTSPDPAAWTVTPPGPGSAPVEVRFPEPLDAALLMSRFAVRGPADGPVEGRVELAEGETVWRFRPAAPWRRGAYRIVGSAVIEDLAGNTPGWLFDVEMMERTPPARDPDDVVVLRFTVD